MSQRLHFLQQLLEKAPNDAFALFAAAKEYEQAGDSAEALGYYLRLYQADPAYVGLYYHLGKLYEKMNRPADALKAYHEGMLVARQAGDLHALSELNGARLELDDTGGDM
ncbi:MAG: tetratricopeptide repeat protein [Saprospirales bacterium]|nr:tetratricopeptide repeat protein [Saprospirales bacterium]